jgi:hypothetical protein
MAMFSMAGKKSDKTRTGLDQLRISSSSKRQTKETPCSTNQKIGSRERKRKIVMKKRFTKASFKTRFTIEKSLKIFTKSILPSLQEEWEIAKLSKGEEATIQAQVLSQEAKINSLNQV